MSKLVCRSISSMLLLLIGAVSLKSWSQTNGVPFGLLNHTFYIQAGTKEGTCFLISYKGNLYLVTARHVVDELPRTAATVKLLRMENWQSYTVNIFTPKNTEVDIAILDPSQKAPNSDWEPELSMDRLNLGGEVYFLGYSHQLHSLIGTEYLPLVKKGVLSAVDASDETATVLYVDGFNNPGFSGGPIVFYDSAKQKWHVAGVIKGFYQEAAKTRIGKRDVDTDILVNSGILVGFNIRHALETIDSEGKQASTNP